jgi:type I restriction enzyme S subunit
MPMLDRKVVHQVDVLLPPPDLMTKFESFATDVYGQIDLLQRQSHKLAAARDLLLPRLMSGELTV